MLLHLRPRVSAGLQHVWCGCAVLCVWCVWVGAHRPCRCFICSMPCCKARRVSALIVKAQKPGGVRNSNSKQGVKDGVLTWGPDLGADRCNTNPGGVGGQTGFWASAGLLRQAACRQHAFAAHPLIGSGACRVLLGGVPRVGPTEIAGTGLQGHNGCSQQQVPATGVVCGCMCGAAGCTCRLLCAAERLRPCQYHPHSWVIP